MKKIFAAAMLACLVSAEAVARQPNYDESKIAPYKLEDTLTFADGTKLASPADWPKRRAEILDIFAKEMYGQPPPAPEAVVTETVDEKVSLAGYAIRRQVKMWFKADKSGPCVNWIVFLPRFAKKPVPVLLFLNYRGNHELVPDSDIPVMEGWSQNGREVANHRASEKTRGRMCDPNMATVFPIGTILARGYAVMSACYCEISPDPTAQETNQDFRQDSFAYTGVFTLWPNRDPARIDNTTAIGAWAWTLSRGLDLAERMPEIDAQKSVVTGCSRLGKSALLAGARDERFAVVVPNQTGGGGAPLAKRDFGENVSTEMKAFTHWYCKAYGKYADNEQAMKFDQHLLLASIAPRHLLIEGFDSDWFDTKGEYLSCRAASPAWTFLGKPGLPESPFPDDFDTSCIGTSLGYVRRSQEHGISAYDWSWMLDFADKAFDR